MADSGGNQRIDLRAPPPVPIVSRPLKTGKEFTLVLPQPRFILKAWDKALYEEGGEAQLLLKGKHLGDKPYTLIIEREDDGGTWTEVDKVQAQVTGGTEAKATYKFPAKKKLTGGKFTKAEWAKTDLLPDETVQMHIEAEGLEGEWVLVVVEKEESPGEWKPETRWDGHIKGGKLETSWKTPPLDREPEKVIGGTVSDIKFADKQLAVGEMAWLIAKAQKMDGEMLRFELERELGPGKWETVGRAVSTIKGGEARAGIEIPKRKTAQPVPTIQTARFEGKLQPGEEATAAITAKNMDGQRVSLHLDVEVGGRWVESDVAGVTIQGDKAQGKLKLPALETVKPPDLPREELVSAKFGKLEIGQPVTLDIATKGMDGQTLTVILETCENGEWVPVAETTAHVKSNAASAQMVVPAPVRLLAQTVAAGFEKNVYREGEDVTLVLDSVGLDGELVDLSIEEEQPDGSFREVAKDRALLKQGPVKVKLVPPPVGDGTGPQAPPGGAGGKKPGGTAGSRQ